MRRVLGISVMFLGALACIVIFNIVLCTIVPPYRDVISSAVAGDTGIPVVEVTEGGTLVRENNSTYYINSASNADTYQKSAEDLEVEEYFNNLPKKSEAEDTGNAGSKADEESDPVVIDKHYYEDCGTGKGYWVLTYSDGRKVVE